MRVASHGRTADYTGITWKQVEDEMGMFWPAPEIGHPGTPRLFEGGKFLTDDERARFIPVSYRPPAEVVDDDQMTVTSRRGSMTLPASVVSTIRPDTLFIPYHWAGKKAANQLTQRALDPVSKIPEYKVSFVRIERATGSVEVTDERDIELTDGREA